MDTRIKQALMDIVGESNFTDALIDRVSYAYDASDHDHRPEAAIWPTNSFQISQILTMANKHGIPITPRGAGTGLAGAAVPVRGGLVLDLCRMNKILDIRIADRLVVVQPGVVYAHLQEALNPYGFFYPPDPASGEVCTLGGNVATNAGGLRCAKYGVTRDYVLGLEVALADGRILQTGGCFMKSTSGLDLTRLFVGSEGVLGVITEITLKISPKPLATKTSLAFFRALRDAGKAIADIILAGIVPSVLELLDRNAIKVLREQVGMDLPEATAMLLVETDGFTEAEAAFQLERVTEVHKKNRATDIREARTAEEAEDLWQARRSVGSAASKLRPNNVSEDVAVPLTKVPDLLQGIASIVHKHNLPFVTFGHGGDGNIHPRIMYDRSDQDQVKGLETACREIFELACRLGGTLTGEHGIGLAKAPYMGLEHDPVALDLMRALKALFDPNNIMNPGKMGLEV